MPKVKTIFTFVILFLMATLNGCSTTKKPLITTQPDSQPTKVLLLGLTHFANPGADTFNSEVDDFFSERRQSEIEEVNTALAKFNADKVFLECTSHKQKKFDDEYDAFTNNQLDLKAIPGNDGVNERYQIGFKLANKLQLDRVNCVDAGGLWLGDAAMQIAELQYPEILQQFVAKMNVMIDEMDTHLATHTLREHLLKLNELPSLMFNHNMYVETFAHIIDQTATEVYPPITADLNDEKYGDYQAVGIDKKYIGADLTGEWFKRNVKIFAKVNEQLETNDEAIILVFGQGHIKILRQLFEDHPDFEVIEVSEYL